MSLRCRQGCSALFLLIAFLLPTAGATAEKIRPPADQAATRVVLLGTGNPTPAPDRSGPATAIVFTTHLHSDYTSTQPAELAKQAKPGLLIIHHNSITLRPDKRPFASSPNDLLKEIREAGYGGRVVVGHDLDVY